MCTDTRRYFIELQMNEDSDVSRNRETEIRRAQASRFVGHVSEWLQEQDLGDKVTSMAVTALGQVLITCEEDIINRIREDEKLNIAAIRPSATIADSVQRVSGG